jgi:hypothetical protein
MEIDKKHWQALCEAIWLPLTQKTKLMEHDGQEKSIHLYKYEGQFFFGMRSFTTTHNCLCKIWR